MPPLSKLLGRQMHLAFRVAVKSGVVLGMTFDPLFAYKGEGGSKIKGIVSDWNHLVSRRRVSKLLAPVIEVIYLQPTTG